MKRNRKNVQRTFLKVQQQNGNSDHMLRCNPEFCHNQSKTAFALGKTEFSFDFHSVADIGIFQLSVDGGAFFDLPSAGPERRIPRFLQ